MKSHKNDVNLGRMKTNLGGKLVLSLELEEDKKDSIKNWLNCKMAKNKNRVFLQTMWL